MPFCLLGTADSWNGLLPPFGRTTARERVPNCRAPRAGVGRVRRRRSISRHGANPVVKSHVNAVVPDTAKWEQSAAYRLDTASLVRSFVKNAGLGFAIPYLHNGEHHEYLPDFIIRLAGDVQRYLILEIKGYDPLMDVKTQAAHRWIRAVNAAGRFGAWDYALVSDMAKIGEAIRRSAK